MLSEYVDLLNPDTLLRMSGIVELKFESSRVQIGGMENTKIREKLLNN